MILRNSKSVIHKLFFQGPIGHDIKTTVKIRNVLFATFSYTYQLLLYIALPRHRHFRSMVPTLTNIQYLRHRSQPPVLSANSICWSTAHCAKMLSSYNRFIWRKGWKSEGAKSEMYDGWSNTSHRKCHRSLFVAAAVYSQALSWRRTIPEDNIPPRLFWIQESNYSTQFTFGGRFYCFIHVYGLIALRTDTCDVSRSRAY